MRRCLKLVSGAALALWGGCLWFGLSHGFSLGECGFLFLTGVQCLVLGILGCLLFGLVFLFGAWLLFLPSAALVSAGDHIVARTQQRKARSELRREMGTELLPSAADQGRGDEAAASTDPHSGAAVVVNGHGRAGQP